MAKDDEKDYMKENKKTMTQSPEAKEGMEEPNVKEYNKVKGGIVAFVVGVIILLIILISTDFLGLFN